MAGSIVKLCERMRYWCEDANLGYDQGNRWDIRVGGESNCSSVTIFSLREADFDTGDASWTGDLSDNLTARGWKRLPADISTCRPGDILLNDACHVCVVIAGYGWDAIIAQASIDERGQTHGGESGDQTGRETNVRGVYEYSRGWDCILRYSGAGSQTGDDGKLDVDGRFGPKSVTRWQKVMGTTPDGVVSGQMAEYKAIMPALTSVTFDGGGSELMEAVQEYLGIPNPTGIIAGGTIAIIQGRLIIWGYDLSKAKLGVLDAPTAKALQQSLNDGMWS